MRADEALVGRCIRGTTNWAAAIGKAVQDAVMEAQAPAVPAAPTVVTEAMHVAAVKVLHRATGLDGLPQRMLNAMLAAAPQPEAQEESDLEDAPRERDAAEDFIDHLLDEVLGHERPEWSSAYGRDDALNDVQERMTALYKPAVDKARARFEAGMAAPQPEAAVDERKLRDEYKRAWLTEPEDSTVLEAYDRGWKDRAALAAQGGAT